LGSLINAQFLGTHDRLDKINGKVQKHDDQIQEALAERLANRQKQESMFAKIPELEKSIRTLQDQQLSANSVKKWLIATVGVTTAVVSVMWVFIQIYLKTHSL
jgi:division protein CdvB (Snf7/Vps24/ESCRT-III family)